MRLLSQISREYKDIKYEKFWIIISTGIIKELNWKKGQELKVKIKNKKLIVTKG